MHNRAILLESNRLENQLINLQIEGALLEVMKNDLMARAIIAEHRKIEKYALQLGLIDKRQLNEGMFADIALGLGQAIGGIPGIAEFGVGAAFGVAGVLWYGKEMMANAVGSFDFFMNLIFALLSAAAVDPTGIFAEAGAFGKLIKPFAYLGQKVRALGGLAKAAVGLGPAEKVVAEAASKAAGPLSTGLAFLGDTVLPQVTRILKSIKSTVMKLPGGAIFTQISELITKHAGKAIEALKNALSPFLRHVETAAVNAQIAGKEFTEALIKKMSPQVVEKITKQLAGKEFTYLFKGNPIKVAFNGFDQYGQILWKGLSPGVQRGGPVAAEQLPQMIGQFAKSFGKDAAAAIIVKAQTAYPVSAVKLGFEALRPYLGSAPDVAAAV